MATQMTMLTIGKMKERNIRTFSLERFVVLILSRARILVKPD